MNFTYDGVKPPDNQWGALQKDGSWSGMVGMLVNNEIDMGNILHCLSKKGIQFTP